jgi:hypothetical protein
MTAIEHIKVSLEQGRRLALALITDMQDAPLCAPTSAGGNHPLWILGHIVHSEANLIARFVLGEGDPLPQRAPLFARTTQPVTDPGAYPAIQELLAEWEKVRAATLRVLSGLTDADLEKPSKAPKEREAMFGTIGKCFSMAALHPAFHAGQVADARRAAGRDPLIG